MPLILRYESLNIIKWWVNEFYSVHGDMRGHTGATMSLGRGSVIIMSKNQKINTQISMESDIIGADYALPEFLSK